MKTNREFPSGWMLVAAAIAIGEAVGLCLGCFGPLWPIPAALAIIISLLGYGYDLRHSQYLALISAAMAIALASEAVRHSTLDRAELGKGPFSSELKVESEPIRRGGWISFLSAVGDIKLRIVMPASENCKLPSVGDVWQCRGWLERRDRSDRRRRTLWIKGSAASAIPVRRADANSISALTAKLRCRLSTAAGYGLEHDPLSAALNRAMVLGERSTLPVATRNAFVRAGTIHVFAVSGLHVGVIALVIFTIFTLLGIPYRLTGLTVVPALWFYVFMIGMPASAVRAATMTSLYISAPFFYRRSNAIIAWSQTFIITHVAAPSSLFDAGSALSFAVMLGILLFNRWANSMRLGGRLQTIGFAIAVWAAGTPIVAHVFARVTPGGLLANLIVVPMASAAVVFGFLGAIVGIALPPVGAHLNNAAALITKTMDFVSNAVSSIPYANVETEHWTLPTCLAWYAVFVLAAYLALSIRLRREKSI